MNRVHVCLEEFEKWLTQSSRNDAKASIIYEFVPLLSLV